MSKTNMIPIPCTWKWIHPSSFQLVVRRARGCSGLELSWRLKRKKDVLLENRGKIVFCLQISRIFYYESMKQFVLVGFRLYTNVCLTNYPHFIDVLLTGAGNGAITAKARHGFACKKKKQHHVKPECDFFKTKIFLCSCVNVGSFPECQ